MSSPIFAVVGRVNKGKSSIVATLAEDDKVEIEARPNVTKECHEFPVKIDGELLFTLVDTPGFEDAPRVLEWLRARETSAAERPRLVAEFLEAFRGTGELVEEQKLLTPIVRGANILYVVDGTKPYRPNYEAEMEILRWTGRPAMALINRIGEGDHASEWRTALLQHFPIVREFDAFQATFAERVRLFRAFRELRPEEAASFDRAAKALEADRGRRRAEAAAIISSLVVDALTFTVEAEFESEAELEAAGGELVERFHDALRERERRARRAVEELHHHHNPTRWIEPEMTRPEFDRDLFARETWRLLGLTPGQQIAAGAVTGATVGGAADAMVGGASFLTGTVFGALAGTGFSVYQVGRRFAKVRASSPRGLRWLGRDLEGALSGRRRYVVGPHAQPNFPWVLLDRALLHYRSVLTRTHARRDEVHLAEGESDRGPVAALPKGERRALEEAFAALRKRSDNPTREVCAEVQERVRELVQRVEEEIDRCAQVV